ncbi:MAG: phosphoribosylglycinamide formyltransferase [Phycisphaerae bacterium]|nr:phosphoribosylglycinamide formyltransferase [Gemmatimonadaceae bacterium]
MRIGILASGGGSNLQAIINHFAASPARDAAQVVLVASNRPEAGAMSCAQLAGIATHHIANADNGQSLLDALRTAGVELLALAGYLKLVPRVVVDAYAGHMLNVHPALLPSFGGHGMYGLRVHEAVIQAGAKLSGVTVHFVSAEYDRGAIAAQWPVAVLRTDTPQSLAARVLAVEHRLYPVVLEAVAGRTLTLGTDGRTHGGLPAHSAFAMNDAKPFFSLH